MRYIYNINIPRTNDANSNFISHVSRSLKFACVNKILISTYNIQRSFGVDGEILTYVVGYIIIFL